MEAAVWAEDSHLPDRQGACVCVCECVSPSLITYGCPIHVERPTWSPEADDISLTCASNIINPCGSMYLQISILL